MKIKELYQPIKSRLLETFGGNFFQDLVSISLISISLLLLLSAVLIIAFRVKSTDYLIPLVYNSTYGVTALGSWVKIYFYPMAYGGFILLNILVAWAYFDKERLISYLVLFVSLLAGLLLIFIEYNLTILVRG